MFFFCSSILCDRYTMHMRIYYESCIIGRTVFVYRLEIHSDTTVAKVFQYSLYMHTHCQFPIEYFSALNGSVRKAVGLLLELTHWTKQNRAYIHGTLSIPDVCVTEIRRYFVPSCMYELQCAHVFVVFSFSLLWYADSKVINYIRMVFHSTPYTTLQC